MSIYLREHFIQDLVQFIIGVLGENNKVIIATDTNKHIMNGVLPRFLKNLGSIETHMKKFDLPGPASHVTGSLPIDSVWASNNITPAEASVFLYKFRADGHRIILVDLNLDQIVQQCANIYTPSM